MKLLGKYALVILSIIFFNKLNGLDVKVSMLNKSNEMIKNREISLHNNKPQCPDIRNDNDLEAKTGSYQTTEKYTDIQCGYFLQFPSLTIKDRKYILDLPGTSKDLEIKIEIRDDGVYVNEKKVPYEVKTLVY